MASTGEGKAAKFSKWRAEGGKERKSLIKNAAREKAATAQKKIRATKRLTGKLSTMQKAKKGALKGQRINNEEMPF